MEEELKKISKKIKILEWIGFFYYIFCEKSFFEFLKIV
jgi:hypothetical protein